MTFLVSLGRTHFRTLSPLGRRSLANSSQIPSAAMKERVADAEPRLSASLILAAREACVEHGREDYKVLMLHRSVKGTFRGAHVFPGGAVDDADKQNEWRVRYGSEFSPLLPHKICAIRETFEECGIFLTHPAIDETVLGGTNMAQWRNKVHHDATEFVKLCDSYGVMPGITELLHYSNWITPIGRERRFDTHFFLAVVDQSVSSFSGNQYFADGSEALKMEWFRPSEALEACASGKLALWPPQFTTLTEMMNAPRHADLFAHFSRRKVNAILPEVQKDNDGKMFSALPGDEYHSSTKTTAAPGDRNRIHIAVDRGKVTPMRMERNVMIPSKI